jgi:multidrug transporter EmrE-like cation transporter
MTTPLKSILLVMSASFVGSFGSVFLKAGAGRLHREVLTLLLNWRLAAGVLLFVLSSFLFIAGVKEGELSILYPMVSLGYIFSLCWSRLFFGEPLTRNKLLGLALIVTGIVFLSLGNRP